MISFCCCLDFCLFVEPGNLMVVLLKNTLSYNGLKTDEGTHRWNWINKLRKHNKRPSLLVLEECSTEVWTIREKYWIRYFLKKGYKLTNTTSGGDGLTMGNQTSFKKGLIPWNKELGFKKECAICGNLFRCRPSEKTSHKTCSKKCQSIYKKANLSATVFKKGFTPWNKGKDGYKLGGNKTSMPVLQYDKEGTFIAEHLGCREAADAMGCIPETIRKCCVGQNKTGKGFIWKYKNQAI